MMRVTKTYGHEKGLSATFRQHRAKSHCRFIHGYALAFTFTFECRNDQVDENGWVINFGGLKPLAKWLEDTFDHKTVVAKDDPKYQHFLDLEADGLIQLNAVERVGCEAFAKMAAERAMQGLFSNEFGVTRARLISVECREHSGNGATYVVDRD